MASDMSGVLCGDVSGPSSSREHCCTLAPLERPEFQCGQLLTNDDLNALVQWAQGKSALRRFLHGWGVVCGLDIRCGVDARQRVGVVVTNGYAVDCCGKDIIVGEPVQKDLSRICREANATRETSGGATDGEAVELFGRVFMAHHVQAVDLSIRYADTPSHLKMQRVKPLCDNEDPCQYVRRTDCFELDCDVVDNVAADPYAERAREWQEGYDQSLKVITDFHGRFPTLPNADFTEPIPAALSPKDVKRWLLQWIDPNQGQPDPLNRFCFVRQLIERLDSTNFTRWNLAEILFWLVQSCRVGYLSESCHECRQASGVPLGRVWMRVRDDNGCRVCQVIGVEPHPPYRRPLQLDTWPAAIGNVNLGQAIWHRSDWAAAQLARLHVELQGNEQIVIPATTEELRKQLQGEDSHPPEVISYAAGTTVVPQHYAGHLVRFIEAAAPRHGLALQIDAVRGPREIQRGIPGSPAIAKLDVDLRNTGEDDLQVRVHSAYGGREVFHPAADEAATPVSSGALTTITVKVKVDDSSRQHLEVRLVAIGQTTEAAPRTVVSNPKRHTLEVKNDRPIGFTVTKSADKERASVGDTVQYTITVVNTGEVKLDLKIKDDAVGLDVARTLAAHASLVETHSHVLTAIGGGASEFINTVTVAGVDDFERKLTVTDDHKITIVPDGA